MSNYVTPPLTPVFAGGRRLCGRLARRRSLRIALMAAMASACALLAACARHAPSFGIDQERPFTSKRITLAVTTFNGASVVNVSVPSGGWHIQRDGERTEADGREVFITITKPDSTQYFTQVFVIHRVGVLAPAGEPLNVYVRVVRFGSIATNTKLYHKAITTQQ